jgi:hypothetical protein
VEAAQAAGGRMSRRHIECSVLPLEPHERGRGVHISAEREAEIVGECLRLMRAGVRQHDIARALNSTRSRVARWCQKAAFELGEFEDRSRLKTRGKTPAQFLWSRIDVRGRDDCWPWTGATRDSGYGGVTVGGVHTTAHRAVYELLIGPPEDQQIDHTCNNPVCCNPRHLQAVTPTINLYLRKVRQSVREGGRR